jgi:hypothetical protein
MLRRVLALVAVWGIALAVLGSLVRLSTLTGDSAATLSLVIAATLMVVVVLSGNRAFGGHRTQYW